MNSFLTERSTKRHAHPSPWSTTLLNKVLDVVLSTWGPDRIQASHMCTQRQIQQELHYLATTQHD